MSLAASIVVKNKNNVWIDDNMVDRCHKCGAEFTMYRRKHHCRNCGNIFCYSCVNRLITIPKFITDVPEPADYWNPSYYITSLKGDKVRVCDECYHLIKSKIEVYDKIVVLFNKPVSIDDVKELPNESYMDVKNHYFDHLRNIQYYLPNHHYNEIDKKLLQINAVYFSGHSKYIVHLIKSIEWSMPNINFVIRSENGPSTIITQEQFVMRILNGPQTKTCQELYCTRICQDVLSCDDCVNVLFSCVTYLPDELMEYLFVIIMRTPESIILCHLPFFVNLIKNNNSNKLLQLSLYRLLSKSKKMIYHTFWFLNNTMKLKNVNIQEMTTIKNFIDLFDKELVIKMNQEYMFFVGLIDNLDDPKRYLSEVFNKYPSISLPYEPDTQLTSVDYNNIKIIKSYTNPVIIPFGSNNGEVKLLFKKESIINDVIVLNLMMLCDIILNENLNQNSDADFKVVFYSTMPLTCNSGMIQIVEKAETIHAINKKRKTILQHIISKNQDKIIKDVLHKYIYSLVSYTLHSYFIGLGDRHLQNIMIKDDGSIFHIDFGYILGKDAYPLTGSNIKLNYEILDVIGGADDELYNTYINLCAKGVILLRKYLNMFFILLSQDTNFDEKHIEKFVMSRFQPRQTDSEVISELMTIIKQSHEAYSDSIRDFLHYHSQEKTVQNNVSKVLRTVFKLY